MKLPRRQFLHLAAAHAALPLMPRIACAQAYPSRPVRLLVGSLAGGSLDMHARLIGQWLSERLGQQFVIENRPGAGGNIATETTVKAPPDGYTLLTVNSSHAINATLYDKLNFNFIRDIAPIEGMIRSGNVLTVTPSFPAKTVSEFITYTKTNPGKVTMGSGGNGTSTHMAGELFKMMTGINLLHVPYRGEAPALTDLLGGQIQVMFTTLTTAVEYIRDGRLRPLAVTTATRSSKLPEIQTVGDVLPGYEASTWAGIGAPKDTPTDIIYKLNREINLALASTPIKARYADLGATIIAGAPADFGKLIAEETDKWGKVIRAGDIKPG